MAFQMICITFFLKTCRFYSVRWIVLTHETSLKTSVKLNDSVKDLSKKKAENIKGYSLTNGGIIRYYSDSVYINVSYQFAVKWAKLKIYQ
jgi:hypothetical protein